MIYEKKKSNNTACIVHAVSIVKRISTEGLS